jgi:hypothetical protein
MLTRTLFLGNTEETWRHTQLMDGPTQQEDSLFLKMPTPKKIFLIRMSMKKFGVLSTLTRTLYLGNTEEMRKLIQPTDGLTQLVDLLFLKTIMPKRISQTRMSTRKFGASLTPIKTLFHGNTEEMLKLIQPTDGLTQLEDSL